MQGILSVFGGGVGVPGFPPYLVKGLVRMCVTVLWETFAQGGCLKSGGGGV